MNLKNLFTEERAVSPVIGVILMVAITVILAAVIGTFVLGLGDSVQQTTPSVTWSGDQDTTTVTNGLNTSEDDDAVPLVTFTHEGGDQVADSNIDVRASFSTDDGVTFETAIGHSADQISAGETTWIEATILEGATDETLAESGDQVRVVWTSDDGSSSATIGSFNLPQDIEAET